MKRMLKCTRHACAGGRNRCQMFLSSKRARPCTIQRIGLQPSGCKDPKHVAINETVMQCSHQRLWLYAAVDPATNEFSRLKLVPV